jgi:hypothetical protein
MVVALDGLVALRGGGLYGRSMARPAVNTGPMSLTRRFTCSNQVSAALSHYAAGTATPATQA